MSKGSFLVVLLINMNNTTENTYTIQDSISRNYERLSDSEKAKLHEVFKNPDTVQEVKDKLESIIYTHRPPTPEEFLDPKNRWLPQDYIDGIYPHIKETFYKAMRRDDPYSIIALYGSTRTGKSLIGRLFTMYTIAYVSYLRDPHTYFGVNKMSRLCLYLISFHQKKTNQVYLSPILDLLHASEMFVDERFEKYVYEKGVDAQGRIHYSQAGKFGDITFPNMYIVTGKDAGSLVGADIIAGAVSEITFFKEYVPGMTDDEIVQVFTKLFTRIQNTVGFGNFPCWSYIDSSANDADSPIEKMVLQDFTSDPKALFQHYILWELRPHLYPKYHETGKTFKVCSGNSHIPAGIIKDKKELEDIPPDLIVDVPIDLKKTFERNLRDSIKDIAGRPTSKENKYITEMHYIHNIFSNEHLRNIEGGVVIDSKQAPKKLIWDQLYQRFFNLFNTTDYVFYRAPSEPRFIGIDPAFSAQGDIYGFGMVHLEWSRELEGVIVVVDMNFPFLPGDHGINLAAVEEFILDLQRIGRLKIMQVGSDTFQSEQTKQSLLRHNIEPIRKSVDTSIVPYMELLNLILSGIIKSGRNIFMKNNLATLERKKNTKGKEIIDHPNGDTNNNYIGDWEKSTCGINAKDVSDGLAIASSLAVNADILPSTVYEIENAKFTREPEMVEDRIKKAYKKLHVAY